jgi:hypothetical protein
VGLSHVFTANGAGMSGFHISHPFRKTAFELAKEALGKHIFLMYGVDVNYEFDRSFSDFEAHLKDEIEANQVKARIAPKEAVLQPCG